MRMCKCGKANQPTRKYCIRCGELLIGQTAEEKPVAPKSAPPPTPVETSPPETSSYQPVGAPDKMSPTTNDHWVRPSEVDSERIRTAERHVEKTELEKAQEAFEKAEGEDIDGRMLRASEIRELMDEHIAEPYVEETPAEIEGPPVGEQPAPIPEPMPESQPAPEMPAASTAKTSPTPTAETPPTPTIARPPTPAEIPPASKPEPAVIKTPPVSEVSPVTTQPTVSDPDIDKRIQEVDSDIAQFNIQLQQYQAELDDITSKNEGNVRWATTVAEQKRIKLEESEDSLRRAKEEFDIATKDLREAENRMKKEVSDAEKRVSDIQKRITNAEKYREKRLKEIEKEKAKEK